MRGKVHPGRLAPISTHEPPNWIAPSWKGYADLSLSISLNLRVFQLLNLRDGTLHAPLLPVCGRPRSLLKKRRRLV